MEFKEGIKGYKSLKYKHVIRNYLKILFINAYNKQNIYTEN